MGSMLQFAAFLSICWLIRGVLTHPKKDEEKGLKNKYLKENSPGTEDFYFNEQISDNDNVKNGRPIPQSAWSKEDKEQTQPVENKPDTQFSDEFSFKNALSYLMNMLHELKKDIFGLKEIASQKNSKDFSKSQDNSEDKVKKDKFGEKNDIPKSDASTKSTDFENQELKSDYITEYYQNNGMMYVDDDLESSSDESDDSSHRPNEGASMHEISENIDDTCISECLETEGKVDKYSSEADETAAIPTSQAKISDDKSKDFDGTNGHQNHDDIKEHATKSSETGQNKSKTSREETKNTSNLKRGKCVKKSSNNLNNLNNKYEPTKTPLDFAESESKPLPNEKLNDDKSVISSQSKTTDNLSKVSSPLPDSEKESQNKGSSDFDGKSFPLGQSTTLSSQSLKDVHYSDSTTKKPYASVVSSEKPINKNQRNPEKQEKAKSLRNNDESKHHTTVFLKLKEDRTKIPNHEMGNNSKTQGSSKKSKGKRLNDNFSHTTASYSENKLNSETNGYLTSKSFYSDKTIFPTTSESIMNEGNLNTDPSDNLNGKKGVNGKKKSNDNQQSNDSEAQRDSGTKQTKKQPLNNDSEPEKSLKNNKLNAENGEGEKKKSNENQQKNYAETQNDNGTGQTKNQQLNDDSKPEKSLKNNKFNAKSGTNENKKSNQQGNNAETPKDSGTGKTKNQQLNNDSEPEKSLKNKKLNAKSGTNEKRKSNANQLGNDAETTKDSGTGKTKNQQLNDVPKPERSLKNNKLNAEKGSEEEKKSNAPHQGNDSETQSNSETEQTKEQQSKNDYETEKSLKNNKFNAKKETYVTKKSNLTQKSNDSETQNDSETEQTKKQQLNDDYEPEKFLKNNKLNAKKGTDEKTESNADQLDNDLVTQRDKESEQTKTQQPNDVSKPENSLKNNKLNDVNRENEDDNLASNAKNDLSTLQDLNQIQSHGADGSDKPQDETQETKESLNEKVRTREILTNEEYQNEEEMEDFDTSDEFIDMETDGDFIEKDELVAKKKGVANDDEVNPFDTTVFPNKSQMPQNTGHGQKEKPREQYDTFLEYLYKHSNNSLIESLKKSVNSH